MGGPFADSLTAAGATWCPIDPSSTASPPAVSSSTWRQGASEGYVKVGEPVTPRELDAVAARAGVKIQPGDVVVVRSGNEAFLQAHPNFVFRVDPHPGLHLSCLEWFRRRTSRPSPGT